MSADSNTPTGTPPTDGPPTPASQSGDDAVERASQQVQGIQLRQGATVPLSQSVHPTRQENDDMVDAVPLRSSPVPSEPTAAPMISSQATTSASSSNGSSSSVASPVDSIKKLVWRRDTLVRLLLDMIDGSDINSELDQGRIENMRSKVEDINRLISTVELLAKL